ncbi:MAG: LPS export ABC transporter periplasmic protein LptC [Candidatus Puniceispirillaceae bacterium]
MTDRLTPSSAPNAPAKNKPRRGLSFAPRRTDAQKAAAGQEDRSYPALSLWLMVLAGGVSVLVLVWLTVVRDEQNISLDVQRISTSDAGQLELTGARYSGRTENGANYLITADKATGAESDLLLLSAPDGILTETSGVITKMRANTALYSSDLNTLDMDGDVELGQSENNLMLRTSRLQASLLEGRYTSNDRVVVTADGLNIEAEGIDAFDNGAVVTFKGAARLILNPTGTNTGKKTERNQK